MRLLQISLLAAMAALAACSSNPYAIEPNPLPDFDKRFQVDRLWRTDTGAGTGDVYLTLVPAITERAVYAADVEGRVTRLDRKTGKRDWKRDTELRISGGVYAGYGSVILGTRDGEVLALDSKTGEEQWRADVNSEVLAAPAADGEFVVVQTQDGHVVALDMATGKQRWSFDVSVPVLTLRGTARPEIDGDMVYAGFASGRVVALDLDTGVPAWQRQVAEPAGRSELDRLVDIDNNLIVDGGGVFASTFQGKLAVLDVRGGRPFWDRDVSTFTPMSVAGGSLFVADDKGHLFAIEQRSGSTLWRQEKLYGRELTGTAVQKGLVVTGDFEGYLHWVDAVDGTFVARRRHDRSGFAGAPVVHEGVLYVLARDGNLAAYRVEPVD